MSNVMMAALRERAAFHAPGARLTAGRAMGGAASGRSRAVTLGTCTLRTWMGPSGGGVERGGAIGIGRAWTGAGQGFAELWARTSGVGWVGTAHPARRFCMDDLIEWVPGTRLRDVGRGAASAE